MSIAPRSDPSSIRAAEEGNGRSPASESASNRQLCRWGGAAGVAGGILMIGAGAVVGALGLPDASDVETLTDFADIESGRIAEHLFYLGALILMALHVLVLHRLLTTAHQAAALFGTALSTLGLAVMAASSLLHVATSPMADLYTAPETPPEDLPAIEYAWHGAQSVFDTMLTTGVLLVPIGIVLLGIAMRHMTAFGAGLTVITLGLGVVGVAGGLIAVVVPGSMFAALGVLAIVVFHLVAGWRTLALGRE